MKLFNYPSESMPTCLLGFVKGVLRLEALGGADVYLWCSNWFFWKKAPLSVNNSGQLFAITHLQKKSRFGFLLMWPFCFHVWFTFKFQEYIHDIWSPGTEKVFYWRIGLWRWDAGDSKFIGPGTWYGPGFHWD